MGIQLNGSSGADIISSSDGTITINGTSTVSTPIVTNTITISDKISHTGDPNTHIRFAGDDTVTVETAGSERIRIDSNGMFHISDRNSGNSGEHIFQAGAFGIRMQDTGGYNRWNIERNYGGWQSTPVVHLSTQGRVGINQATPTAELEVSSVGLGVTSTLFINAPTHNTNAASEAALKFGYNHSGGQAVGYIKLNEGGGNSFDGNLTVGVPYNQGSGNFGTRDALTIKHSGRVGIGTDNPDMEVEVYNGGIKIDRRDGGGTSNPHFSMRTGAGGLSRLMIYAEDYTDDNSNWVYKTNANEDHIFHTAATERLRIKADGNIVATGNIKSNNISGHNIIHNGAFNIAQRGVGLTTTATGFQTVDRWRISYGNNSAPIWQKHIALTSGAPYDAGFRYSYQIHSIGHSAHNNAYCYAVQSIEARDIANSGWNYTSSSSYINLSFWVKANVSQNYLIFLHTNDTVIKEYCMLISLTANTWTKVTKAIPGNSGIVMNNDNGVGLQIWFTPALGSGYTSGSTVETWQTHAGYTSRPDIPSTWWTQSNALFEITGVQLEVGSTDTPFEHRSYGEEIALCQRFFVAWPPRSGGTPAWPIYTGGNQASAYIWIPYTMRTSPTPTDKGTGTSTTTGYAYNNNGQSVSSRYANNTSPTLSCGGENGQYSLKMDFGAYGSGGHEADIASWNGTGPGIFLSAEI